MVLPRAARRTPALLVALVVALLGARTAPPALADEWDDARKEFRRDVKSEDAKVRAAAYQRVAYQDRAEAVDEILGSLGREANASVVLAGIKALGRMANEAAQARVVEALRTAKGTLRLYLLVSLSEQRGAAGAEALLEVLRDAKDPMAQAQAALALAAKGVKEAEADLRGFLALDDWHLRSAAARALAAMPGLDAKALLPPLADALRRAEGRDRTDLVAALEKLSGKRLGYDAEAWTALAAGADPAGVQAKPPVIPHFTGLPLAGRRLVLLVDNGVRTDDQHPFDVTRLQEVCAVPGARPVPWYEIRTIRQLIHAHALRAVADLSGRGAAFDLIPVGQKVRPLFGKLTPVNDGTRKAAGDLLAKIKVETAHDDFGSLTAALDISGKKDSVAWSLGPDEILYATCTGPWLAEVADGIEVAAAIGLKARLRMVPVHTVGVGEHPHEMLRDLAALSGGTYLSLGK